MAICGCVPTHRFLALHLWFDLVIPQFSLDLAASLSLVHNAYTLMERIISEIYHQHEIYMFAKRGSKNWKGAQ